MGASSVPRYLILSPEPWSSLPTNKHQIAARLHALHREVLYVDWVGKSILSFLRRGDPLASVAVDTDIEILRLRRLPQSVTHRVPALLSAELYLKRKYLQYWLKKHDYQPSRVIAYDPTSADLHFENGATTCIYHCVDHYASFPDWQRGCGALMTRMEKKLVRQSDYVIVTSQGLLEHWSGFTNNIQYMPNVADTELFGSVDSSAYRLAAGGNDAQAERKSPQVFFHGNLVPWKVDFDLIRGIAAGIKDAGRGRLTLVGPIRDEEATSLRVVAEDLNIQLLSPRPQAEIVGLLEDVDILLLPYVVSEHTRHVFPLKLMEYMATGVPIISTRLPSIVGIANQSIEFIDSRDEAVELICRRSDWRRRGGTERRAIARGYSWTNRVAEIELLFDSLEKREGSAVAREDAPRESH